MIHHPIDGMTASSGNSDPIALNKIAEKDELTVQVVISAAATVSVKGRLSADAPWVELISITADSIQPLALVSYLRFDVSGNTGVVDAYVRS